MPHQISQTKKNPIHCLPANGDRAFLSTSVINTTLSLDPNATDEISHPLLRSMFHHWDQCPKERRQRYVEFLRIHKTPEDLNNWTSTSFEDFEHSSQVMILGAIACCCCSDLFHVMVKRRII